MKDAHSLGNLIVVTLAIASLGCLDGVRVQGPGIPPPPPPSILPPTGSAHRTSVSVALHLHGWSNHSGSPEPASIAWHTQQNASAGVDILWWTDHSDIYARKLPDFLVTPQSPSRISSTTWSVGTWSAGGGRAFLRAPPGSSARVDSAISQVTVAIPPSDPARTDTVELFFGILPTGTTTPRRASFVILARPLVGDPVFTMPLWPVSETSSFPKVEVVVPLAWHPRNSDGYREVLRYELSEQARPGVRAIGDTVEFARTISIGDSSVIRIQPKGDASVLSGGEDNTTDEYRIRFVIPRAADSATFSFKFPTVSNALSSAAVQMPDAEQTAHTIASGFGIRAIWGIEAAPVTQQIRGTSWDAVSGAGRHIAVYMPGDVTAGMVDSLGGDAAALASLVRSRGGLTSIAHPFGTGGGLPTNSFEENQALVDSLGNFLVRNGAWGVPLIEVGYTSRGGVGITEHLQLLDYLIASGIPMCGVGVTDSHGGRLLADPVPGSTEQWNYVTWIGGLDRLASEAQLLNAMSACHTSFGNPFYVRGGFWIDLIADSNGNLTLDIDSDGVSPSADLYLYEAEIDSSGTPHRATYRQSRLLVPRGSTPQLVGGCHAGFVRLEAWAGNRPIAFSNLLRIPPDPRKCP